MVEQPTVKAVLHSLRGVLSSSCRLHGAHLYVLGSDGESLHLLEFDREADAPAIKIGTKISRIGAVARVLEEQKPVFLTDVSQEMLKYPELAPFAAQAVGRSTYIFPVSTAQQRYGILVVTKERGQEFVPEDVELLRSLASHVAVALECALARDCAEQYQRELARERDRLRLLLEINNHVVSKLDINESSSLGFRLDSFIFLQSSDWVLAARKRTQISFKVLLQISPTARGCWLKFTPTDLTDTDYEKLRGRQSEIWSIEDIEKLPATVAETLKSRIDNICRRLPAGYRSGPWACWS